MNIYGKKLLKRFCIIALSAAVLTGSAAAASQTNFIQTSISVSAAETLTDDDFQYKVNQDGTVTITKYTNKKDTEVTIPSEIDGKNVISIGEQAFSYRTNIIGITIPKGVKSIGEMAFIGCKNLTSITFPDSMTNIGNYAFYDCSYLLNVTIPNSVINMGEGTFYNCKNLRNISLSENTTNIGNDVFHGCESLKSIIIPKSVTGIGYQTFFDCKNLKNITIPESITYLRMNTFYNCTNLTSITLPNSLTDIGNRVFYNCTSLMSITIPNSVMSIGDSAFYGCDNLTMYGTKDSYAEQYANENDITFEAIGILLKNTCSVSAESIVLGNKITLTGVAEGGKAPYTYAYYYKKTTDKKWVTAKGFSDTTSVSIKPTMAKDYEICIKVKDADGKVEKKYFTVKVNDKLAIKASVSAENIKLGSKVTLNGAATGGSGDYTYAYYYKKTTDKKWVTAKGFSSTTSVSIRPAMAKDYEVCIKVKDAAGATQKQYFTVKVTN